MKEVAGDRNSAISQQKEIHNLLVITRYLVNAFFAANLLFSIYNLLKYVYTQTDREYPQIISTL